VTGAAPGDGATAIFEADGDLLVPTWLAQGPWDPRHQHGGPPAAALVRAVERCDAPAEMRIARITVDLMRAVPMAPLRVTAEVVRSGRRIQAVDARIEHDGTLVARATALRIRVDDGFAADASELHWTDGPFPGPHEGLPVQSVRGEGMPGIMHALQQSEMEKLAPGRGRGWFRLVVPLVAGEPTSPTAAMAVVADMASGISSRLDFERYLFHNADLTLHLLRTPEPGWIGVDGRSQVGAQGVGQAEATLLDERGPFGRVLQSLLLDRR
jgi:hypothetical protein